MTRKTIFVAKMAKLPILKHHISEKNVIEFNEFVFLA